MRSRSYRNIVLLWAALAAVVIIAGNVQGEQKGARLEPAPPLVLQLNSTTEPYQIKRTSPEPPSSRFVTIGEEFGFERGVKRFKVQNFTKIFIHDPVLGQRDVSELSVKDLQSGRTFVLVHKIGVQLPSH